MELSLEICCFKGKYISMEEQLKKIFYTALQKASNFEVGESITLPYIPMGVAKDIFENLGFSDMDGTELETNGWQHDFWNYFRLEGRIFLFSGSWWDGDYKITRES